MAEPQKLDDEPTTTCSKLEELVFDGMFLMLFAVVIMTVLMIEVFELPTTLWSWGRGRLRSH